jgi:HD-GYP domain-containing protein (c-di-GMP phosphodiesterase class II)
MNLAVEIPPTFTEFAQRALELGAVCWFCDRDGNLVPCSTDAGPQTLLYRSSTLRNAIETFARSAFGSAPGEIFPGCIMLGQSDPKGTVISLLLTRQIVDQPGFADMARELGSDAQALAGELSPLLHGSSVDAQRVAKALCRYQSDLAQSSCNLQLVDQFNTRLSQSFEEMTVLFRMAKVLNTTTNPSLAIKHACDQLLQTLPFGWFATWFADERQVVPQLAGRLTKTGLLPCEDAQLISFARSFCSASIVQNWDEVLLPGRHELATLSKSEILTEPITREGAVVGVLLAGNKTGHDLEISSEEMQFVRAMTHFISVYHENTARLVEQRAQFMGTLRALSASIDAKDKYTRGHSERVSLLASQMARVMNLDDAIVEQYRIAGLLHDVGKIGVPEATLQKCGKLTDEEFAQIKQHPQIGYTILKDIPAMQDVLPGVLHHHERWDGAGYPNGIRAEQIPLLARCLAFADTFDAMSSSRSYRKAMLREKVIAEIRRCAGSQFDPDLISLFTAMDFTEFDRLLPVQPLESVVV